MTREQAIEELRTCYEIGQHDGELAHLNADGILCALLLALGYEDVVEEWKKVHKWYA